MKDMLRGQRIGAAHIRGWFAPSSFVKRYRWALGLALLVGIEAEAQPGPKMRLGLTEDWQTRLLIQTAPGASCLIEASRDLIHWDELFKIEPSPGDVEWIDSMAPVLEKRFYRAREYLQPPANDHFSERIAIGGSSVEFEGVNFRAGKEPGEPDHAWIDSGGNSVWWSWQAPQDGPVTITALGSHFDTLLAVYQGSNLTDLKPIARKAFFTKRLTFDAKQGQSYELAVAGNFNAAGLARVQLVQAPEITDTVELASAYAMLTPDRFPDKPKLEFLVSADGTDCVIREKGKNNVALSGRVIEVARADGTARLALETAAGKAGLQFIFKSKRAGHYLITLAEQPFSEGRFINFHQESLGLAVPDLEEVNLNATRLWTSTGTSGQVHYYTFGANGRFHDSDGVEHASGSYAYDVSGATARLTLSYKSPADFVGDKHELTLHFESSSGGTFTSQYHKNDGTEIEIRGGFELDDE